MLRRALPGLTRICNIVKQPASNCGFLLQIECCRSHQFRDRSVVAAAAAAVVRSLVGPSVFQRGFAARPETLLVHFPLPQTGEGAPAVDMSPRMEWVHTCSHLAPTITSAKIEGWHDRALLHSATVSVTAYRYSQTMQTTYRHRLPAQHGTLSCCSADDKPGSQTTTRNRADAAVKRLLPLLGSSIRPPVRGIFTAKTLAPNPSSLA